MTAAKTTKDHEAIKEWVEERDGVPAIVTGTEDESDGGLLRVKFDENEEGLEEVEWDEFFDIFDDRGLTFLYQDDPQENSRFFKFIRE